MAVLTNTMLQGTSADTGEDGAYQIEKSLRFHPNHNPAIRQVPARTGNKRVWTWAGWVKRTGVGTEQDIFSCVDPDSTGIRTAFRFENDKLAYGTYSSSSWQHWSVTTDVYRDIASWMHIVLACDTTNQIAAERTKLYVNGKRVTMSNDPAQNLETFVNYTRVDREVGGYTSASNEFNGYMADVHFIDGMQLSPAAFGSFDSTGIFNPKAFALPAPNAGTTYSGGTVTGSNTNSGGGPAQAFDGRLYSAHWRTNNSEAQKLTFGSAITVSSSLNFYCKGDGNQTFSYWMDGTEHKVDPTAELGANTEGWVQRIGAGSFQAVEVSSNSGGNRSRLMGIEVDGGLLINGKTDITTRDNPNDGRVWSDLGTASGTPYTSAYNHTKAFDGSLATQFFAATGPNSAGFTFTTSISNYETLEMLISGPHNNLTTGFKLNGVDKTSAVIDVHGNGGVGWVDIGASAFLNGAALSSFEVYSTAGNTYVGVHGIKVDGHWLVDNTVDNSFHLKFNDTTDGIISLGLNSFSKDLTTVTHASKPILKTNSTGTGLGSGYNTDSDAADLLIAIPGNATNGIDDVHDHISGTSGSAIATTNNGSIGPAFPGKNYGSSIEFGNSKYISTASIDRGSDDLTIEAWVKVDSWVSTSGTIQFPLAEWSNNVGNFNINRNNYGDGTAKDYTFSAYNGSSSMWSAKNTFTVDEWFHACMTYDHSATTLRFYCNGEQVAENTSFSCAMGDQTCTIGGASGGNYFNGQIVDWRVYSKVKYTSNFDPHFRKDFVNVEGLRSEAESDNASTVSGTRSSSGDAMVVKAVGGLPVTGSFNNAGNCGGNKNAWWSNDGITWYYLEQFTGQSTAKKANWLAFAGGANANASFIKSAGTFHYSYAGSSSFDAGSGSSPLTADQTGLTFTGGLFYPSVDSMVDSPTSYAPTTGSDKDGGVTRGNYCTWNSLRSNQTNLNGNLQCYDQNKSSYGTFLIPKSDKWYFEVRSGDSNYIGIDNRGCGGTEYVHYNHNGQYQKNGGTSNYGASYGSGDFIGVAINMDDDQITFYKNGSSQGAINFSAVGLVDLDIVPLVYSDGGGSIYANFGQQPFKHAAPAGYKCLCSTNIPNTFSSGTDGDENDPALYFNVKLWEGNSTNDHHVVNDLKFKPDLIIVKNRDYTDGAVWHDSVRGMTTQTLYSHIQDTQYNQTNRITYYDDTGFKVGWPSADDVNEDGQSYVSWMWDAGTAGGANNDGDTNVSSPDHWKNSTSGFSITKYSGGSGSTSVGHGLSAKPHFVIVKCISGVNSQHWTTYHKDLDTGDYLKFTADDAVDYAMFNDSHPDTTKVPLGNDDQTSGSSGTYIMYAWTPIPGFSHFGKYTGNGSTTGPFVYTGFAPKLIILKREDDDNDWMVYDRARDPFNEGNKLLKLNSYAAETTSADNDNIDFLSNGFKIREDNAGMNANNGVYVFAAWAEHPHKTARAL